MAALVVGATRGLGRELCSQLAKERKTFGTSRSSQTSLPDDVVPLSNIDVAEADVGARLVTALQSAGASSLERVYISAGLFKIESFDEPSYEDQVAMYKVSSCRHALVAYNSALAKAGLLAEGTIVVLVSSEAGSITLRHDGEGGGNYGHHAGKAALNMVGKLLSFDLAPHRTSVLLAHPGFMRSDMTRGVGFDKYWDAGGAIQPSEAAASLIAFVENEFTPEQTGTFWAPRGSADIGTAEATMGKDLPTPLQLPW